MWEILLVESSFIMTFHIDNMQHVALRNPLGTGDENCPLIPFDWYL